MRERYCKVCQGWHELDNWPYNCMPERNGNRSDYAAPMLIRDGMEPVQSMLDGKMYDSKHALRATYKAAGVVEIGNDSSLNRVHEYQPKKAPDRKKIKEAVGKAMSRAGLGA